MNFKGVIIEESLRDTSILRNVKILETKTEQVTPRHKTPWLKQWTLHTFEIPEGKAESIAHIVSKSIDNSHGSWYADFKNNEEHYIIFSNKIFKIDRRKKDEYRIATEYGISIGIPDYQVDFSPFVKGWER